MNLDFYDYIPKVTQGNVHTLIAGTTGSGKSVLLNGILLHALTIPGSRFFLIDPKRTELAPFRSSSHTAFYADDDKTIAEALTQAVNIMTRRFATMQANRQRKSTEAPVYIIIDELAVISRKVNKELAKVTDPLLSQICTVGRAANVFLIACTQRPTQDVITPLIKVNCDCKIALRAATAAQSRNVIDIDAAHYLPRYGECIIAHPDYISPIQAPVELYDDQTIDNFILANNPARRPSLLLKILSLI